MMRDSFDTRSCWTSGPVRLGLALAVGTLAVLLLIGLVSASSPVIAAAGVPALGDLDVDFGAGGVVTTPIGLGHDWAYGVAVQEDGKIVVAGCQQAGSFSDFALARYTGSGALDASFGTGGIAITPIAVYYDCANDVVIQADGKIVAAGHAYFHGPAGGYTDFAVARYTVSGTLDAGFGTGGIAVTPVITDDDDGAEAVAIQPDGKIVMVGSYDVGGSYHHIAIVRYTISGTLDATFGAGGIVTTSISPRYGDRAYAVAIQDDGGIVVAGGAEYDDTSRDTMVLRYTVSGTLDHTFGSSGVVTTPVCSAEDEAYSVAIQDDGKIVVAGNAYYDDEGYNFALARYTISGTLDTAFGVDGVVTTPIGTGASADNLYGAVIQEDGKIVVAGIADDFSGYGLAVARYTAAGALDPTFGVGGIVTTSISPVSDFAYDIALQKDGKIVVAGYTHTGADYDFAVVRYHGAYNVYLPLVLRNG